MRIMIDGVGVPSTCGECIFKDWIGYELWCNPLDARVDNGCEYNNERHPRCPIKEIPNLPNC